MNWQVYFSSMNLQEMATQVLLIVSVCGVMVTCISYSISFTFEKHDAVEVLKQGHRKYNYHVSLERFCRQAEDAGKLGRSKIQYVIFLHPNMGMCTLHHMVENT